MLNSKANMCALSEMRLSPKRVLGTSLPETNILGKFTSDPLEEEFLGLE